MMRSFAVAEEIVLTAGATSPNVLNGTRLSPVLGDGFISVWVTGSVDGVEMELQVQSDNICSKYLVSDANRYPIRDEDWAIMNIPVGRTEVIDLKFTDAAGAGANVKYIVAFSPRMNPNFGAGFRR